MDDEQARELIMLRRVWRAMGCAGNPDDFKPTVRDVMWGQILDYIAIHARADTRLHRENTELLTELRAAEARAAEAEAVVVALMEATSVLGSTDAEMIQWIGTAFESTRSQEVLARVKAEAWDEGRQSVGRDFATPTNPLGIRAATQNPYRAGADQ